MWQGGSSQGPTWCVGTVPSCALTWLSLCASVSSSPLLMMMPVPWDQSHPITSFYLNHPFKYPISKQSHLGFELCPVKFGGTQFVHNSYQTTGCLPQGGCRLQLMLGQVTSGRTRVPHGKEGRSFQQRSHGYLSTGGELGLQGSG